MNCLRPRSKFYNSIVIVAVRRYLPGLIFAFGVTFIGFNIHWRFSAVSPLVASLVIGVVLGNLGAIPRSCEPGQKFAAKRVLRFGIVLLGTQLAAEQIVELGGREVIVNFDMQSLTKLQIGDQVEVRLSDKSISLLHPLGHSDYQTLREKLHWNEYPSTF